MDSRVFCHQCGREAGAGAMFCVECGARLAAPTCASVSSSTMTNGVSAEPAMAAAPANGASLAPSQFTTVAPVHYGGFWIRFVATFLDGIIVQTVALPVAFVLGGMIGVASIATSMPAGGARIVGMIVGLALGIVASWIYEAAMESSAKQATLGKMIFNLQVTDLNGQRISFARASGRHFGKYVSGMILLIGYIMAGFSEKKQALHDLLANTLVKYTR